MALIVLLSPAKRLRIPENLAAPDVLGKPVFLDRARVVMNRLKEFTAVELAHLQSISSELALENQVRNRQWRGVRKFRAVDLFDGEVYRGLAASQWSDEARARAGQSLRILSGLYGWLRPDDGIEPYRLEMGTAMEPEPGVKLNRWWSEMVTQRVLRESKNDWVVDLASAEYGGIIRSSTLEPRRISMDFLEDGPRGPKPVQVYFKQARGRMARWILETGAAEPTEFEAFQEDGYCFSAALSKPRNMVFLRSH